MTRLVHLVGLIGVLVGFGCLKVAQQNAVVLHGYAVGRRAAQVRAQERDLLWLNAEIAELASPGQLSKAAQARQLKLVAWVPVSSAASRGRMAAARGSRPVNAASGQRRLSQLAGQGAPPERTPERVAAAIPRDGP